MDAWDRRGDGLGAGVACLLSEDDDTDLSRMAETGQDDGGEALTWREAEVGVSPILDGLDWFLSGLVGVFVFAELRALSEVPFAFPLAVGAGVFVDDECMSPASSDPLSASPPVLACAARRAEIIARTDGLPAADP